MSDYIYSGSRIKTLENNLLGKSQMEVILSAKDHDEVLKVLHESFVGHYLAQNKEKTTPEILELIVADTKRILVSIAPEPKLLHILWLKYDFYNLSAIIKGNRKGLSTEELEKLCFDSGVFPPANLIEDYKNKNLNKYEYEEFRIGVEMSKKHANVSEVDRIMNVGYFRTIREISKNSRSDFLKEYVKLLIDFFNVQANLRSLSYEQTGKGPRPIFIDGGSISKTKLNNKEDLLKSLSKIGSHGAWDEAIEDYKKTGSYSMIETVFDNQIENFVRQKSVMGYSIACFFAYFQGIKNNVQIIRTILVAKRSGLPEHELRKTIRKRYG